MDNVSQLQAPTRNVEQITEIQLSAVEGYRKEDVIEPDEPYGEGATVHITAEQQGEAELECAGV